MDDIDFRNEDELIDYVEYEMDDGIIITVDIKEDVEK